MILKFNSPTKVLSILFLFVSSILSAQSIKGINEAVSEMGSSSESSVQSEGEHLETLAHKLTPYIMLQGGAIVKPSETNPVTVITDVASVSLLKDSNPLFNNIEIIKINLQNAADMQEIALKLSELSSFTNLKYIYFRAFFRLCPEQNNAVSCEKEKIASLFQGDGESELIVVYTILVEG